MSLPAAVASGPGAATPDAVRPLRVGIGAGVLAASYLFAMYVVHPVPDRLLALCGGHTGIARTGGLELIWTPPAGAELSGIVDKFADRAGGAVAERRGDALVISVPRIAREDVAQATARIAGGGLELREVIEGGPILELERLGLATSKPGAEVESSGAGVEIDVDQWRSEDGGASQTDYHARAHSRQLLDDTFAKAKQQGWQLPPHTWLGYERVEPPADARDPRPYFRTYFLSDEVALDGGEIASATGSFDPNTNRPIVLFDLTPHGAQIFGDVTARVVGHKLAIVLAGEVMSAPIINGPIRGGRASIAMGAGDPVKQERERDQLVMVLRASGLPRGGTVLTSRYVEPAGDAAAIWFARLALALGGGALLGLVAWAVVRRTAPVRRRAPARSDGPFPAARIAITLLAPLAVLVASWIPLPAVDSAEMGRFVADPGAYFNAGVLGLTPLVSAYVVVEIVAAIVPGWRRRRHAGADARAPIHRAVAGVALAFVVLQGWGITLYLSSVPDLLPDGTMPRAMIVGTFVLATLGFVGVAALIRAHGLGNGYGALIAGGWLVTVVRHGWDRAIVSADHLVALATVLALAIPIAVALRWRIARVGEAALRVPTSGFAPVAEAGGLVVLAAVIGAFRFDEVTFKLGEWARTVDAHRWLAVAILLATTLLWSFLFARPRRLAPHAERVGLAAPANESWWRATALSAAVLLFVGSVALVAQLLWPSVRQLVDVTTIAIITAFCLDAYDDLRARRVELDRAWELHSAQHVAIAERALADAGIPCHLASSHLRTLLALFGPFVPIDVLVPVEHVPAARERLRAVFASV